MNILFVCTGNTCRSAMAAAIAAKIAEDRKLNVYAESAGILAGDGESASANAVRALEGYGIDLSSHNSKRITEDLMRQSDVILTMTAAHKSVLCHMAKGKVFTLAEYAGEKGDIPDPFGGDEEEYAKTAEILYKLVEKAVLRAADGKND